MNDWELEDLAEYLADTEQKLTERGLEFNKLYWTSQWKNDTKKDREVMRHKNHYDYLNPYN